LRSIGSLTSLLIALGTVVFSLVIAAPAAYALAQLRIRGAGIVLLAILVSQMIPGIVVANAIYSAYSDLGLLNSVFGLILADSTLAIPFAWGDFLFALTLTTTGDVRPVTLGLYTYVGAFVADWSSVRRRRRDRRRGQVIEEKETQ
jgi:multiple sugar transport system permease protein